MLSNHLYVCVTTSRFASSVTSKETTIPHSEEARRRSKKTRGYVLYDDITVATLGSWRLLTPVQVIPHRVKHKTFLRITRGFELDPGSHLCIRRNVSWVRVEWNTVLVMWTSSLIKQNNLRAVGSSGNQQETVGPGTERSREPVGNSGRQQEIAGPV
jgi:hypothetical protein